MALDLTAAAASSAASVGAAYYVHAAFGIPIDALGCGLAGSFIGLFAAKTDASTLRAIGQFVGYGIGGAVVGNWASANQTARDVIALLFAAVCIIGGAQIAAVIKGRSGEITNDVIDRVKGGKK